VSLAEGGADRTGVTQRRTAKGRNSYHSAGDTTMALVGSASLCATVCLGFYSIYAPSINRSPQKK